MEFKKYDAKNCRILTKIRNDYDILKWQIIFGLSLDSTLKDMVIFWKTDANYRVTIQCMTVAEGIIMKSERGFGPILVMWSTYLELEYWIIFKMDKVSVDQIPCHFSQNVTLCHK